MLECNKNYIILALNYILKNLKKTLSVLGINRRYKNNNILRKYTSNIHLQMLFLASTLLNSEPYTI